MYVEKDLWKLSKLDTASGQLSRMEPVMAWQRYLRMSRKNEKSGAEKGGGYYDLLKHINTAMLIPEA